MSDTEVFYFISLRDIAKNSPYSQDYLSLQARKGLLKAKKIGRNWSTTHQWLLEYIRTHGSKSEGKEYIKTLQSIQNKAELLRNWDTRVKDIGHSINRYKSHYTEAYKAFVRSLSARQGIIAGICLVIAVSVLACVSAPLKAQRFNDVVSSMPQGVFRAAIDTKTNFTEDIYPFKARVVYDSLLETPRLFARSWVFTVEEFKKSQIALLNKAVTIVLQPQVVAENARGIVAGQNTGYLKLILGSTLKSTNSLLEDHIGQFVSDTLVDSSKATKKVAFNVYKSFQSITPGVVAFIVGGNAERGVADVLGIDQKASANITGSPELPTIIARLPQIPLTRASNTDVFGGQQLVADQPAGLLQSRGTLGSGTVNSGQIGSSVQPVGRGTLQGQALLTVDNLNVKHNASVGDTLIIGSDSFAASVVAGNSGQGYDLAVEGGSLLGGPVQINNTLNVSQGSFFNGPVTVNDVLNVNKNATIAGDLTVGGALTANIFSPRTISSGSISGTTISGQSVSGTRGSFDTLSSNQLTASGDITLGGNRSNTITVNGSTIFNAPVTFNSTAGGSGLSVTGGASFSSLTVTGPSTLTGTTTLGAALVVGTMVSDPASASNGTVYYNSSDGALRAYTSGAWNPLGGGFTKSGSLVTLATLSDLVAIGTSTAVSPAVLSVYATSSTATALTVKGTAGQSANIFSALSSAGTNLFSIGPSTTTVADILQVSTVSTSTFANGIQLSSGCFRLSDGNCAGTAVTGTQGQVPFYAATGNVQSATSTIFIATNATGVTGNVGIGTTTPRSLLQIAGVRPQLTLTDTNGAVDNKHWFVSSQGGNLFVGTANDSLTSTSTYATLTNAGNFGIGTTTPASRLSVAGNVYFDSNTLTYSSSSASSFTIAFQRSATTTIPQVIHAWSISTTTAVGNQGILSIDGANGRIGIGTTTPWAQLAINPQAGQVGFAIGSSTATQFLVDASGRIGIGTTSPQSILHVASVRPQLTLTDTNGASDAKSWFISSQGGNLFVGTSNDAFTSTSTYATITNAGNYGIGTTSPYARLAVAGKVVADSYDATNTSATSTFAGGIDVAGGALYTNFSNGVTSIDSLQTGTMSFEDDAGQVTWTDMAVTSASALNTVESYSAQIDSNSLLTLYALSDGVGGILGSPRVGIASSTPWGTLSVETGTSSIPMFVIADQGTTTPFLLVDSYGRTGIGTSTPGTQLSVAGNAYFDSNIINFSSSSASSFTIAINRSSTTTVPQVINSWNISTTTTAGNQGILSVDGANGRVGIGTTTPWAQFAINPQAGQVGLAVGSSTATSFLVDGSGNIGIATSSPWAHLSVEQTAGDTNLLAISDQGTSTPLFIVDGRGNVGIGVGTATSTSKLTVNGSIGFMNGGQLFNNTGQVSFMAAGINTGEFGSTSISFLNAEGQTTARIETEGGAYFGTGKDGSVSTSTTMYISSNVITPGRSYADGIAYKIITPTDGVRRVFRSSASDTLSNGITAGDEVLIINMLGGSGDTADVGNYEFKMVESASASTITFTTPLVKSYDGTTASNQSVLVQRVPHYLNISLYGSSASITTRAWDGLVVTPSGAAGYSTGIIAFRVKGRLWIDSGASITAAGSGYRGAGAVTASSGLGGASGESYTGVGSTSTSANLGAGGGGTGNPAGAGGGGAGYESAGATGSIGNGSAGVGGSSYGGATLGQFLLGSGGGSGGSGTNGSTTGKAGGAGGGIIFIASSRTDVLGSISANGGAGVADNGGWSGGGGGGSGGSLKLITATSTLGSSLVTASGGAKGAGSAGGAGGAGSNGRIRIEYTGSVLGSTFPHASVATTTQAGVIYSNGLQIGSDQNEENYLAIDSLGRIGLGTLTPYDQLTLMGGKLGFGGGGTKLFASQTGSLEIQGSAQGGSSGEIIDFMTSAGTSTVSVYVDTANFGTGADGAVSITSGKSIATSTIAAGRSYADGIAYRVKPPQDGSQSVSSYSSTDVLSNGITAGDEVLVINMQGDRGDINDAGNFEFKKVAYATSTAVFFDSPLSKSYNGKIAGNQKVIIQRVPNYTNVTISGAGSLTTAPWEGLATAPSGAAGYFSGLLVFRASGTVSVGSGTAISASGTGYRGGPGGGLPAGGTGFVGAQGESIAPQPQATSTTVLNNFGGGGGGPCNCGGSQGGGGGGGYVGSGTNGSGTVVGTGGAAYGENNIFHLFLGSGGGGASSGSNNASGIGGNGGRGGGAIMIFGSTITVTGTITSNGQAGQLGTSLNSWNGSSAGGSGGSIKLIGSSVTLGSSLVTTTGGAGATDGSQGAGGAGSLGRIRVEYMGSLSGSATGASTAQIANIAGSIWANAINLATSSANTLLTVTQTGTGYAAVLTGGNVGIGTTSPSTMLSVGGNVYLDSSIITVSSSSAPSLTIAYQRTATSTVPQLVGAWNISTTTAVGNQGIFSVDALHARIGISTSTPSGKLSIYSEPGDSEDLLVVATTSQNYMSISSTGTTTIDNLVTGALSFDTNAGVVSWMDMPVTSGASLNTVESYSAAIDSVNILTVYGQSDGVGSILGNFSVGIGTTTPWGTLAVEVGTSTSPSFVVSDQGTSTPFIIVDRLGNVGIGTTTPARAFSIAGSLLVGGAGTSTVQNNLDIQGTSHATVSYTGDLYFRNDFRFTEASTSTVPQALYLQNQNSDTLFTLEEGGNVGISTTTPWATLSVEVGTTTSPSFVVSDQGTSTPFLIVDRIGNVGIGTSTPSQALSVAGSLYIGGAGTSTIENNLNVQGTLHASVVYGGDLYFANNFRFTEAPSDAPYQAMYLQNQEGQTALSVDDQGRVGIGTEHPTAQLELSTSEAIKASGTTWSNPSDRRLKENITTFSDGLAAIVQINPVRYTLNGKGGLQKGLTDIGIIAQDMKEVLPYTITTFKAKLEPTDAQETELYKFNASALTFVLVNGVKELNTKVDEIKHGDTPVDKLSIVGNPEGDLLYVTDGQSTSSEPVFKIAGSGKVVVRDDIAFAPKTSYIPLVSPTSVAIMQPSASLRSVRSEFAGQLVMASDAHGIVVYSASGHALIKQYAYGDAPLADVTSATDLVAGNDALYMTVTTKAGRQARSKLDFYKQTLETVSASSEATDLAGDSKVQVIDGGVKVSDEGATTAQYFSPSGFSQAFDENSALGVWGYESLKDRSQRHNDLVTKGSVAFVQQGVHGQAASFDGTSYVSTKSPVFDAHTQEFTFGTWFKLRSLVAGQSIANIQGALSIQLGQQGKLVVEITGADGTKSTRTSSWSADTGWHAAAVTYSTLKKELNIYVDGVVVNDTLSGDVSILGMAKADANLEVGNGLYGFVDDTFVANSIYPEQLIRSLYLVGSRARGHSFEDTSGTPGVVTSASITNGTLVVGGTFGVAVIDTASDAIINRIKPNGEVIAVAAGQGGSRVVAGIVDDKLWMSTDGLSVRDTLDSLSYDERAQSGQAGAGVGGTGNQNLSVFEELTVTGSKIMPESASGLPVFAITQDGAAEGLAFKDVSFDNKARNGNFEYWEATSTPAAWSGTAVVSKDAKLGASSVQLTANSLSTLIASPHDFEGGAFTLSAWVKSGAAGDARVSIVFDEGQPTQAQVDSAYHSGSGQWERLLVRTRVPVGVKTMRIRIISTTQKALFDGIMAQQGSLPTAFVAHGADILLSSPAR